MSQWPAHSTTKVMVDTDQDLGVTEVTVKSFMMDMTDTVKDLEKAAVKGEVVKGGAVHIGLSVHRRPR